MRLAVVSPFVDRRHGTERALAELLERLAQNYHCEIHLYAQKVDELPVNKWSAAQPVKNGVIFWHKLPFVPGPHLLQFIFWLIFNSLRRSWDRRIHGLHFDLVLSPGINCLDADVVIVHALFYRLQELARSEDRTASRPRFFRRLHRRAYYGLLSALERRIYMNPKASLAAVSRRTSGLLATYFHRLNVVVIPNGVNTAQFCTSARVALRVEARRRRHYQVQDFVLLLIGNDWRVKGLETILRAVAVLRDLPLCVLVAGSDSPEAFRQFASELGILERCRFESPRQDVLDFYAAADLYVSPSLEDSFGLPVAEAMACGLPAVTSRLAGVADLIRSGFDGFVLEDPKDSGELGHLLEELFRDPGRRQQVGDAAAQKALEWNWDRNAAGVWEVLENIAARHATSHGSA